MTSKIAEGGVDDAARLRSITNSTDEATRRVLRALPVSVDGALIDIGAGTGSIARWMAETWPAQTVLAVDQDASLLIADPGPANLDIVETDIRHFAPDRQFDIVHARFLLAHLADRDELVSVLADMVAPGGHLVITEPCGLDPYSWWPAVTDVMTAYAAYCERIGMDLRWSKMVPNLMLDSGLTVTAVESRAGRLGGGPDVDRWAPLIARVQDDLIAAGLDRTVLDEFAMLCHSPHVYDIPQVILTTVATRPE